MSRSPVLIAAHKTKIAARSRRKSRSVLRLLERIWHVRGSVPLAPGQSREEALSRLGGLLAAPGTTYERDGDAIVFVKKDPAAQDRLSVFDRGTLRIEEGPTAPVLRYQLVSRILFYCFLAPMVFLAIAQGTVTVVNLDRPETEKKAKAEKPPLPMNAIDKALGAPAPEKKKKDDKDSGQDKKPTPTAAYVFAGIFAALYVAGRILEDRLARRLFGRCLAS